MIIDISDARAHLNVASGDDTVLITHYIQAAQDYLAGQVDCLTEPTRDDEGAITMDVPAAVKQAARLLVGSMYQNRETAVVGANLAVLAGPLGVSELISPYRTWFFG